MGRDVNTFCTADSCKSWELPALWGATALQPSHPVNFVQLGASCGQPSCAYCGEPVWRDAHAHRWDGLVLEASPAVFPLLQSNYRSLPSVTPLHAALVPKASALPCTLSRGRAARAGGDTWDGASSP